MRSSSAVVVKAGTNQSEICLLAPLAFEIQKVVSEMLHKRLRVEGELLEHSLPHVIGPR